MPQLTSHEHWTPFIICVKIVSLLSKQRGDWEGLLTGEVFKTQPILKRTLSLNRTWMLFIVNARIGQQVSPFRKRRRAVHSIMAMRCLSKNWSQSSLRHKMDKPLFIKRVCFSPWNCWLSWKEEEEELSLSRVSDFVLSEERRRERNHVSSFTSQDPRAFSVSQSDFYQNEI